MAKSVTKNAVLGPKQVPTDTLTPNPHNPRILFDKQPLQTLKDSIIKVGILVPITVFRAAGSSRYTILDGQRRWICAKEIDLKEVPINEVPEPSTAQNIVMMFQIHKLRLDWELMPTALKLEVLMKELKEKRDRQLAELTGLDVAVVSRCKKLLSYPRKFQERMLFAKPEDRIKADLLIEIYPIINDRTIKASKRFEKNDLTDRMLEKYEKKQSGIKAVTDFRKIKQALTVARSNNQEAAILKRFEQFVDSEAVDIEHLEIRSAKIHNQAKLLTKELQKITGSLVTLEVDLFVGEDAFWDVLGKLYRQIRLTLQKADRRLP